MVWLKVLFAILAIAIVFITSYVNAYINTNTNNYEGFNCEKIAKEIEKYPRESLDIFFDAKFSPECCPTPYTSSSGCLCPTNKDAGIITTRGGNRMEGQD